jgi:hypothetical protein
VAAENAEYDAALQAFNEQHGISPLVGVSPHVTTLHPLPKRRGSEGLLSDNPV